MCVMKIARTENSILEQAYLFHEPRIRVYNH